MYPMQLEKREVMAKKCVASFSILKTNISCLIYWTVIIGESQLMGRENCLLNNSIFLCFVRSFIYFLFRREFTRIRIIMWRMLMISTLVSVRAFLLLWYTKINQNRKLNLHIIVIFGCAAIVNVCNKDYAQYACND